MKKKVFKEEESIEMLKVLGLITKKNIRKFIILTE